MKITNINSIAAKEFLGTYMFQPVAKVKQLINDCAQAAFRFLGAAFSLFSLKKTQKIVELPAASATPPKPSPTELRLNAAYCLSNPRLVAILARSYLKTAKPQSVAPAAPKAPAVDHQSPLYRAALIAALTFRAITKGSQ